jgi:hypothetical protein
LRRGKAGASACPAAGRGGAVARCARRRCAGKSRAVREELLCDGCGRIRTGAARPRVENIGGRRREGSGRAVMARQAGRRSGEAKVAVIARRIRKEQLRSDKAVRAEATRRRFDAQRKTGGSGRPVLMAPQQMERAAELQDPEVRAELNRRVHECKRKCFTSGRLGSFPQAGAYARQPTTRMQAGGRWCGSRVEAAHRRCNQARRSCRKLRGCAGRVSVAHVREQRKFNP